MPKNLERRQKTGFLAAQIGGGQKWAPYLFRLKSIFYKNANKQNLLPFLNSYYYQNCCRADSFQHLYINNARKVRLSIDNKGERMGFARIFVHIYKDCSNWVAKRQNGKIPPNVCKNLLFS